MYYKFFYPDTESNKIPYPALQGNKLIEFPLGYSKGFDFNWFILKLNGGIKFSFIQSLDVPFSFYRTPPSTDTSHLFFYQYLHTTDPYTLFYKYFMGADFNYKLKNNNLIGFGINFTGVFNGKNNPQIEGRNYFYYYDIERGEGYLRNAGAYLGIKLSYIYGHGKKKENHNDRNLK